MDLQSFHAGHRQNTGHRSIPNINPIFSGSSGRQFISTPLSPGPFPAGRPLDMIKSPILERSDSGGMRMSTEISTSTSLPIRPLALLPGFGMTMTRRQPTIQRFLTFTAGPLQSKVLFFSFFDYSIHLLDCLMCACRINVRLKTTQLLCPVIGGRIILFTHIKRGSQTFQFDYSLVSEFLRDKSN